MSNHRWINVIRENAETGIEEDSTYSNCRLRQFVSFSALLAYLAFASVIEPFNPAAMGHELWRNQKSIIRSTELANFTPGCFFTIMGGDSNMLAVPAQR